MLTAFTSTSSFGHRFDLTVYEHKMPLYFQVTAFVPFLGLEDRGLGKEKPKNAN